MAERQWTEPQWDAITAAGGQVLVSAAAGSGKTAVLVERAIRLICHGENPVDANRLLIVTFSNAAAAEMRQRMSARLSDLIRESPADMRLLRQQTLLQQAQISTVHSFCLELVRQNFQDLAISPDFTLIDQGELEILMNDCVRDSIEAFYAMEENEAFLQLVEMLAGPRDDRRLVETVFRIYNFCRSHPFYQEWLDRKLEMYRRDQPVAGTVWGKAILGQVRVTLEHCLGLEQELLELVRGEETIHKAYGPALESDLQGLQRCLDLLEAAGWDDVHQAVHAFRFQTLGRLSGNDLEKQRVQNGRKRVKKLMQELAERHFCSTDAQFREDLADLQPKIDALFSLVKDFSLRLDGEKSEKRRLHFSDLEHLSLSLLVERDEAGYRASQKAREIAARYDYVLVDEYQDTNEVQDLIFSCVSQGEENLFVVGDVKQSIYSFRQAMPEIFMAKKERFFPYDGERYPARINLDTNFRSRMEVTGAVNLLFGMLMSREMGDVEYCGDERLRCGAVYPDGIKTGPELLLTGMGQYQGSRSAVELEAAAIARRICGLLDSGYRVADKGISRPAALRDICILMRSPRNRVEAFVREMARHGIPASADNAGGFLAAREVSAVVSLLKALDNPLLDVELVAAMLSPLFPFTDDDIATTRLAATGVPFFLALRAAAETGNPKAEGFLQVFGQLQVQAALLPAHKLLLQLYQQTGALAVFRAMSMGEGRKANLQLLVEYAATYHQLGYKRLGGFVAFLSRLEERGGDLAPAGSMGEGASAVRIMSIHRSKGLEFPIVILADTAHRFNKTDLRQNTQIHSQLGFACVRRDEATMKQWTTVPLQAIRLASQQSLLSEEMRVLYVALTRAREKLILSGVVTGDLPKKLGGLCQPLQGGKLPPFAVGGGDSYLDWALMALLHHPSGEELRELAGADYLQMMDDGNPWEMWIREPVDDSEAEEVPAIPQRTEEPDPALLRLIRERAAFVYPHLARTAVPAKMGVSDLAKGGRDLQYRFSSRPKFLMGSALTPAEQGNAMHKFMQFAHYEKARDNLADEVERMRREQFLSVAEAESLRLPKLRKFLRSPLAKRIFACKEVYRELKFAAECGKDMLGDMVPGLGEDDRVVLQGVADCVFLEEDGAVILDYKTDAVTQPEELVKRYETQLTLYRGILGKSLGKPVKEGILYSFHLSEAVKIF